MSGTRHRRLLHFALGGTLLFAVHRGLETGSAGAAMSADPARVAASAGSAAGAADDESLLADEARRLGLDRSDPVVRWRLVQNLRFLGRSGDADALWREALALGMDASDAVVRRRLAERMEARLRAAATAEPPDEAALRAFHAAHREAWRRPRAIAFRHVFFSRDRRGAAAEADARAARARLIAGPLDPGAAGDPFLLGARMPLRSLRVVQERFGGAFAREVAALAPGVWSEPIPSAYGFHLVRVEERRPGAIPPFEAVRASVAEAWRAARGDAAVEAALAALRSGASADAGGGGGARLLQ